MRDLYDELGGQFNRAKSICDHFNLEFRSTTLVRGEGVYVVLGNPDRILIEFTYQARDYDLSYDEFLRRINVFFKERNIDFKSSSGD